MLICIYCTCLQLPSTIESMQLCLTIDRLTVAEVNEYLDNLAAAHTKKERPNTKKALQLLLRNTSALEQKWLIRIILKVHAIES